MKKLPENFCIKCDQSNPLWEKYINWLNEKYRPTSNFGNTAIEGDVPGKYYGYVGSNKFGNMFGVDPNNCTVITLEQWNEAVNGFVLPEKWCIKDYKDSEVHKWFEKKLGRVILNRVASYYHYPEMLYGCCTSSSVDHGYTEITFEQFKKYVLREDVEGSGTKDKKSDPKKSFLDKWYEIYKEQLLKDGSNSVMFGGRSIGKTKAKEFMDHLPTYTGSVDPCNGYDSLAVNIFSTMGVPPRYFTYADNMDSHKQAKGFDATVIDKCVKRLNELAGFEWASKKIYTIEDLSEGKVALVNDGTNEELTSVLKAAFPEDGTSPSGTGVYYYAKESDSLWMASCITKLIRTPTQSVKEFIKQIKTENMDNRFPFKLTEKDAKRIVDIACSGWKPRLSEKWGAKLLENGCVTIEEPFYKEMRKACTDKQNELFDEIFGKDEEQFKIGDWVTHIGPWPSKYDGKITHKIKEITHRGYIYVEWEACPSASDYIENFTKATPEEIAKAQCPYEDGELCFVKEADFKNIWELRYAVGKVNSNGDPLFYLQQYSSGQRTKVWGCHKSAKGVELPKD